jgi:hypothetical protein
VSESQPGLSTSALGKGLPDFNLPVKKDAEKAEAKNTMRYDSPKDTRSPNVEVHLLCRARGLCKPGSHKVRGGK